MRPTVIRGLSDVYGSWKTICALRRKGRSCPGRQRRDVLAVEDDAPARGLDGAQDEPPGGRLAAAALPDEAERLPGLDGEADAVDGAHDAPRPSQQPAQDAAAQRESA